ncbi:DUF4023 domain-containing protein [Oceanobacillus bengalensis]|uniref:DUF4023 domain-containing protein n=1 Tax=Oceanobacillus bengalensis TaxID=1435466 RepID=A0A494YSS5_9BACI|nr:DUF4023 domain-containing protein [Oceanobacillus bengalensis]RKQ12879.1 DUF4023 domain-containing protein [Oceanobacillus bengalensis]
MDNTHEFVEKVKENQRKDLKNKKSQGKGHPDQVLPNKKH